MSRMAFSHAHYDSSVEVSFGYNDYGITETYLYLSDRDETDILENISERSPKLLASRRSRSISNMIDDYISWSGCSKFGTEAWLQSPAIMKLSEI